MPGSDSSTLAALGTPRPQSQVQDCSGRHAEIRLRDPSLLPCSFPKWKQQSNVLTGRLVARQGPQEEQTGGETQSLSTAHNFNTLASNTLGINMSQLQSQYSLAL